MFERRIQPLFEADHPNSCSECHLAGIDLEMFARSTPCETMACLAKDGLVDLEQPDRSKVLSFIGQAEPESDLVTDEVIRAEYDAFLSWIQTEAECRQCAKTKCSAASAPFCESRTETAVFDSENDPGGCDDKTIEQLFLDTVYASRGRCSPCHLQKKDVGDYDPPPPRWIRQSGSCEAASLATLLTIERAGYIDVEDPSRSLLILKPLDEADGGVAHGGAAEFHADEDAVYLNFSYFVERYAECKSGS